MDVSPYPLDVDVMLAQQYLGELRAQAQRHLLVASLRPPRRPWRISLGAALIALGRLLLGPSRAF